MISFYHTETILRNLRATSVKHQEAEVRILGPFRLSIGVCISKLGRPSYAVQVTTMSAASTGAQFSSIFCLSAVRNSRNPCQAGGSSSDSIVPEGYKECQLEFTLSAFAPPF